MFDLYDLNGTLIQNGPFTLGHRGYGLWDWRNNEHSHLATVIVPATAISKAVKRT